MKVFAALAVGLAGFALYRYSRHRQQFMSYRWLNEQERKSLEAEAQFECAAVNWDLHRWS
jgi:hypothetical protein